VHVTADDLLALPHGTITEAGLRQNINVGIGYIEAWLRGAGCVPLYHLMEDAATAEISRAQIWQWKHGARLDDGRTVDLALCRAVLAEELAKLRSASRGGDRYEDAARLFEELMAAPAFPEFLTLPAYERITAGALSSEGTADDAAAGHRAPETRRNAQSPSFVD
jgi:malate synthase